MNCVESIEYWLHHRIIPTNYQDFFKDESNSTFIGMMILWWYTLPRSEYKSELGALLYTRLEKEIFEIVLERFQYGVSSKKYRKHSCGAINLNILRKKMKNKNMILAISIVAGKFCSVTYATMFTMHLPMISFPKISSKLRSFTIA